MKGRVKYFNESKGFGFIIGENDSEYFFHFSNVKTFELPVQGTMVQFNTAVTNKGPCAIDISIIKNNQHSSIIILGDVRLKLSNIKNYGITKKKFPYEKIYELEQIQGKLRRFLFGENNYVWKGRIEKISEQRHKNLKAVNEKEEYNRPGHMPWRADTVGICSTYIRYLDSNGKIQESNIYTNEWNAENPPYVMKEIDCLYVTTYQNDNFICREDECNFDIFKKCSEIDVAFSS